MMMVIFHFGYVNRTIRIPGHYHCGAALRSDVFVGYNNSVAWFLPLLFSTTIRSASISICDTPQLWLSHRPSVQWQFASFSGYTHILLCPHTLGFSQCHCHPDDSSRFHNPQTKHRQWSRVERSIRWNTWWFKQIQLFQQVKRWNYKSDLVHQVAGASFEEYMNIYLHIFLYDVYLSINYILVLFIIFQVPFAQRMPYSSLQHNISLKNSTFLAGNDGIFNLLNKHCKLLHVSPPSMPCPMA